MSLVACLYSFSVYAITFLVDNHRMIMISAVAYLFVKWWNRAVLMEKTLKCLSPCILHCS